MEEAQRFMRYLTPGILFVGELALLLFIVDPCTFKHLMDNNSNPLALVAATFIISGGAGYFLSLCHHFLLWTIYSWCGCLSKLFTLDYNNVLKAAIIEGSLKVKPSIRVGSTNRHFRPKPMEAWQVSTALWNILVAVQSTNMKDANKTASRLLDITYGIGAVSCGSIIAIMLVIYFRWDNMLDCRFFVAMSISALFACVAFRNLYVTTQHAIGFMKTMLQTALSASDEPITVVVSDSMFRN